jgi:hypothetical protein
MDGKKDDFWNSSSDDDFWSKPVSEDWLKDDDNSQQRKETESRTEAEQKTEAENRPEPERKPEEKLQKETAYTTEPQKNQAFRKENPYIASHVHQEDFYEEKAEPKQKKRLHVHTIICLCALGFALCSIFFSLFLMKIAKDRAYQKAIDFACEEVEAPDELPFHENNIIYLEDTAYTISNSEDFKGFPEDEKVIGIYFQVKSDTYIRNSYALKDVYIGYEEDGNRIYKKPLQSSVVGAYVRGYGFTDKYFLNFYGCGNGSDDSGFFFFIVPADTEEISLYIEDRNEAEDISVIEKVYRRDMQVLPKDEALTEALTEREVQ